MLIGIIQPYRISSLKRQSENSCNINYNVNLANSASVPFCGLKEIEAAEKIIKRHTWGSGILGGVFSQIIGVDSAAHAGNNFWMVRSISKKIYKLGKVERRKFQKDAALSAAGVKAAAGWITVTPVLGNVINAGVSAKITRTVGDACVELCEKKLLDPSLIVESSIKPAALWSKVKTSSCEFLNKHKITKKDGESI